MTHPEIIPYSIVAAFSVAFTSIFFFIIPRSRMERRARALLAQCPGAEQTSVYLQLNSPFPWDKQREMDAKIAEMQTQGWTFLRARQGSWLQAFRSWGGSLMVDFIRIKV